MKLLLSTILIIVVGLMIVSNGCVEWDDENDRLTWKVQDDSQEDDTEEEFEREFERASEEFFTTNIFLNVKRENQRRIFGYIQKNYQNVYLKAPFSPPEC